ncbi:MAG: hypothetical protein WC292_01780 [Clostridia bacterium]
METDFMEKMARDYNRELRMGVAGTSESLLRDCLDIVERQLDLIIAWLQCGRLCNRALSYLESLKRTSLRELNALLGNNDVPAYRERRRSETNMFNRLVDLQIELFIALDRLKESGAEVDDILEIETRALGIMGVIR